MPNKPTESDIFRVLAGWKNKFNSKDNRFSEENYGIAFATMTSNMIKKGKGKNKKITFYKCKKDGHYANECIEDDETEKTSNKKGSSFLLKGEGRYSDIEEE